MSPQQTASTHSSVQKRMQTESLKEEIPYKTHGALFSKKWCIKSNVTTTLYTNTCLCKKYTSIWCMIFQGIHHMDTATSIHVLHLQFLFALLDVGKFWCVGSLLQSLQLYHYCTNYTFTYYIYLLVHENLPGISLRLRLAAHFSPAAGAFDKLLQAGITAMKLWQTMRAKRSSSGEELEIVGLDANIFVSTGKRQAIVSNTKVSVRELPVSLASTGWHTFTKLTPNVNTCHCLSGITSNKVSKRCWCCFRPKNYSFIPSLFRQKPLTIDYCNDGWWPHANDFSVSECKSKACRNLNIQRGIIESTVHARQCSWTYTSFHNDRWTLNICLKLDS